MSDEQGGRLPSGQPDLDRQRLSKLQGLERLRTAGLIAEPEYLRLLAKLEQSGAVAASGLPPRSEPGPRRVAQYFAKGSQPEATAPAPAPEPVSEWAPVPELTPEVAATPEPAAAGADGGAYHPGSLYQPGQAYHAGAAYHPLTEQQLAVAASGLPPAPPQPVDTAPPQPVDTAPPSPPPPPPSPQRD